MRRNLPFGLCSQATVTHRKHSSHRNETKMTHWPWMQEKYLYVRLR